MWGSKKSDNKTGFPVTEQEKDNYMIILAHSKYPK